MTISKALRAIATEIESTAVGSSRVDIYRVLANQIRAEADRVEALQLRCMRAWDEG